MSSDPEFWELLGNPLVSGGAAMSPENEGCTVGAVIEGEGGRYRPQGMPFLFHLSMVLRVTFG